jgi:hypothetical protein
MFVRPAVLAQCDADTVRAREREHADTVYRGGAMNNS